MARCALIAMATVPTWIKPRNGARKTSTGKVSYRRLWKCAGCRKPFSVLVGSIFERSQVPLSKWLMALFMMSASKGVAAFEVQRTRMAQLVSQTAGRRLTYRSVSGSKTS